MSSKYYSSRVLVPIRLWRRDFIAPYLSRNQGCSGPCHRSKARRLDGSCCCPGCTRDWTSPAVIRANPVKSSHPSPPSPPPSPPTTPLPRLPLPSLSRTRAGHLFVEDEPPGAAGLHVGVDGGRVHHHTTIASVSKQIHRNVQC